MKKRSLFLLFTLFTNTIAVADTIQTKINFQGSFTSAEAKLYANEIKRNLPKNIKAEIATGTAVATYSHDENNLSFTFSLPFPHRIYYGGSMRSSCSYYDPSYTGNSQHNRCWYRGGSNQGVLCGSVSDFNRILDPNTISCTRSNQKSCYNSTITVNSLEGTMTVTSAGGKQTKIKCKRGAEAPASLYDYPDSSSDARIYWIVSENNYNSLKPYQCNIPPA